MPNLQITAASDLHCNLLSNSTLAPNVSSMRDLASLFVLTPDIAATLASSKAVWIRSQTRGL